MKGRWKKNIRRECVKKKKPSILDKSRTIIKQKKKKRKCFKSTAKTYLLVYVVRPEPGLSSLVWVTRQQWRFILPNLINILNYYQRLTNGLSIVDQNRDFLMNWVHLKQQRALVPQVLLSIFILEALLCQGNSDPHTKHARPEIQQDNLVCHCYYCDR